MTTQIVTPVTIPIKNIVLEPGSVLTIIDITWEKFEAILEELGEKRSARIAYSNGVLEYDRRATKRIFAGDRAV